ncbi:high mobility group B protein 2 [Neltuma alba]|uniref:high mobility group B protein 2 n=1 Tax=Neltuma alba TaxID=207710 RepID=UPI0010A35479|nr:high mobility group B protein 2-like [Prosopis alba]
MPKANKTHSTVDGNRLKRKGAGAGSKRSRKPAKDPNKPKRPPSAFFVFMSEFREQYKKEHPENKSVTAVGKAGGNEWKAMSDADKAPYIAKAEKKKAEYEKTIKAYNMRLAEGKNPSEQTESDKSNSEVNDDDKDDEEEEEADE